uniref:D(4) dopamine receptor n=1 Tax=Camelus bactrianus TaxID=9837 RepID=A0A9W3ERR6_CAMBA|nr:D(4) dopamine receptor [Camelus bactrianus]
MGGEAALKDGVQGRGLGSAVTAGDVNGPERSGQTLVCVSVAAERALQTPTNYFIVSLAAADLLLALLVLPLFVYSEVQGGVWLLSPGLCDALMAMDVMLCTASIFNLCAISVDSVPAPDSDSIRVPNDAKQVPGLPTPPGTILPPVSIPTPGSTPAEPQPQAYRRRAKITGRERKAMRVLPVVVGAFLVCWTPFFVVHITRALCPTCAVSPRLVSAVTWLGYVNSALNPVIYTIFNAEFRNVFRKTLRLCC